jgi:endogenous inhibitor of DNA gyrase (YacG/DUF329 family)
MLARTGTFVATTPSRLRMDSVRLCVYCRHRSIDLVWRPFCSKRCKLLDLQDWVDGRYNIPGEPGSSLPHDGKTDENSEEE